MDREFEKYGEEYLIDLLLAMSNNNEDLCEEEEEYLSDLQEYLAETYDGISVREAGRSYKKVKVIQGSKVDE